MLLNRSFRLTHEGADLFSHVHLTDMEQSLRCFEVWVLFHEAETNGEL